MHRRDVSETQRMTLSQSPWWMHGLVEGFPDFHIFKTSRALTSLSCENVISICYV